MADKRTFPQKLSQGACISALFIFFAPGIHWPQEFRNPKQALADSAAAGMVASAMAIGLAIWSLVAYRSIENKSGLASARGALVFGLLGLVGWSIALVRVLSM